MNVLGNIRDRMQKRAAYNRTLAELKAMPLDTALDLDIYPGEFEQIAHRAVYGR